jgi:hemolysin III
MPLLFKMDKVYHDLMREEEIHDKLVYYTEAEERANRFTHGLGALLSIVGVTALIMLAAGQGDSTRTVAACIYGGAMVTFYCLSTAYHTVRRPYIRYVFRILDHASIYLMIAGSYTPFAMVTLGGFIGKMLLGAVWGLGSLGAVLKIFTAHKLRVLGPILYLTLGWIVLAVFKPLSVALSGNGLTLLFAGGAAYTIGVLFYLWDRLPFNHAIWHLFVLAGSACHYAAIFSYVTPLR